MQCPGFIIFVSSFKQPVAISMLKRARTALSGSPKLDPGGSCASHTWWMQQCDVGVDFKVWSILIGHLFCLIFSDYICQFQIKMHKSHNRLKWVARTCRNYMVNTIAVYESIGSFLMFQREAVKRDVGAVVAGFRIPLTFAHPLPHNRSSLPNSSDPIGKLLAPLPQYHWYCWSPNCQYPAALLAHGRSSLRCDRTKVTNKWQILDVSSSLNVSIRVLLRFCICQTGSSFAFLNEEWDWSVWPEPIFCRSPAPADPCPWYSHKKSKEARARKK